MRGVGQARRVVAVEGEAPRLLAPELVGRAPELATLEAALAGAAAGNGRVVLIAGDAGIGKTSLLRSFLARARSARAGVLVGECSETGSARPFGPFVEILRMALATSPADVVERSLQSHSRELVRFLPERAGAQTAVPSAGVERFQSHESFAMFFADLARSKPLVLAIEDVHFADPATLELLPYLARRLRDAPALIVLTHRGEELAALHPLRSVLAELERSPQTTELHLRPLGAAETSQMLQGALGLSHPPTSEFRQALDEVCEGNPLFIEEVLKTLALRGDLVYRDGAWRCDTGVRDIAIPDSVQGAVEQRVRALATDAQRIMRVAAVIGRRFDFDLVQRVSELSERSVLDALGAAIDAQLIVQAGDADADEFSFRHALTREAVLSGMLPRERRSLHRAVGVLLEERSGRDPASAADALAYHFDEAGDDERALRYHELAAQEASGVFAFAAAVRHLERACVLAPRDPRTLASLTLRLAEAARHAHQFRHGLEAAETARSLFVDLGDVAGATAALSCIANCHLGLGDLPSAARLAAEAVRVGAPLGRGPELAEALRTETFMAHLTWNLAKAEETGEAAIRLARESGASDPLVQTMTLLGAGKVFRGRPDEGLAEIREAVAIAMERGGVSEAEFALHFLWVALHFIGAPRSELRAAAEERLRLCRERGYRNDHTLWTEIELAFADGEWDRVFRLAAELQDTIWAAFPAITVAFAGAAREGPERFLERAQVGRRRLLDSTQFSWASWASSTAALCWLAGDLRGTLDQAAVFADQGERRENPGFWAWQGHLGPVAIYALLAAERFGDAAALERWSALMRRDATAREPHARRAARLFARAREAARAGELDSALGLLEETKQPLTEDELPFALTVTRLERADLLLRRGAPADRAAAAGELAAAVSYWERTKATWYLGELRRWAARRKLPFPVVQPQAPARTKDIDAPRGGALSRREREVAELVAQGKTDAEIAERLTISVRTAEGHVEHIRNKLGFHSRVQIGTWVAGTPASSDRVHP